jgi:hypothetical protein
MKIEITTLRKHSKNQLSGTGSFRGSVVETLEDNDALKIPAKAN